jgi:hypothetical protein
MVLMHVAITLALASINVKDIRVECFTLGLERYIVLVLFVYFSLQSFFQLYHQPLSTLYGSTLTILGGIQDHTSILDILHVRSAFY